MDSTVWIEFRRTWIRVETTGGFFDVEPTDPSHIGSFPPDAFGPIHVVTAWNPQGIAAADADNRAANRRLLAELSVRPSLIVRRITGFGGGPFEATGTWREEGFGIEGLSRAEALALGARFDQRAIFEWRDEPGGFRLVACDGSADEPRGWISTFTPHPRNLEPKGR